MEAEIVPIEVLMLSPVHDGLLDILIGPERPIEHLAGFQILELHPDEGFPLPRLDVLVLLDGEELSLQ